MSKVVISGNENGTGVITVASPNTNSNLTLTLPEADGTSGQFLKTDGSGNLSFGAAQAYDSNLTSFVNTFTLPTTDGSADQVLKTNGSGTLSFTTPAGGAWEYISSVTASSSSTVDFTGLSSTYDMYAVQIIQALPDTNSQLALQTSTNNGSSFRNGASDYYTCGSFTRMGLSTPTGVSQTSAFISCTSNTTNIKNDYSGASGWVYLVNPSSAKNFQVLIKMSAYSSSNNLPLCFDGVGTNATAEAINAIRFTMESGTITSGTFRLYGIKNS